MKYDDTLEKKLAAIFGGVGTAAILVNMTMKGYSLSNVMDAIKDISGLAVTLAVFLIASQISSRSKGIVDMARSALERLSVKYKDHLQGPDFDKQDYNPESASSSSRMKYLFFKPQRYNKKVAFIPLDPIEQGILDIRVSKATLVNMGVDGKYPGMDGLIASVKKKVKDEVESHLRERFKDQYEVLSDKIVVDDDEERSDKPAKGPKYKNSAIVVSLNLSPMKPKKIENAILSLAEVAYHAIKDNGALLESSKA